MELLDNLSCPDDGLGCLSAWLPRYTKRTKLLLLATRRPAGTVRDKEMSDAVFGLMETEVELHQILHVMEHGPFDKMLAAEMMEKLLQAKVNIRKKNRDCAADGGLVDCLVELWSHRAPRVVCEY